MTESEIQLTINSLTKFIGKYRLLENCQIQKETPTKTFYRYIAMTFNDRIFHPCIYWLTPTEKFPWYISRELQWENKK